MDFEVNLPLFKGPFDLLLFFIERDELDVYDIPISKITDEFLDYLKHLEKMNIEVASEFILVASTLMSIKAKLLLPRTEKDEQGNEIDPREELIRHLLEYKKYKSVLDILGGLEEERLTKERRGNVESELKKLALLSNVESELQEIDLYKLLKTFQKTILKFEADQNQPVHTIVKYPYSIEEQKDKILRIVYLQENTSFTDIMNQMKDKIEVIFSFLAILELLTNQMLSLHVGDGYNNFWLKKI